MISRLEQALLDEILVATQNDKLKWEWGTLYRSKFPSKEPYGDELLLASLESHCVYGVNATVEQMTRPHKCTLSIGTYCYDIDDIFAAAIKTNVARRYKELQEVEKKRKENWIKRIPYKIQELLRLE